MGKLLIGTTVLMAALDGGLTALIVAAALGGGTYLVVNTSLNAGSQNICDTAEASLHRQVNAIQDQRLRQGAENKMEKKMKELRKRRDDDAWGSNEVAKLVAIGTFAFPPAAIGVAAHLVRKHMMNK